MSIEGVSGASGLPASGSREETKAQMALTQKQINFLTGNSGDPQWFLRAGEEISQDLPVNLGRPSHHTYYNGTPTIPPPPPTVPPSGPYYPMPHRHIDAKPLQARGPSGTDFKQLKENIDILVGLLKQGVPVAGKNLKEAWDAVDQDKIQDALLAPAAMGKATLQKQLRPVAVEIELIKNRWF